MKSNYKRLGDYIREVNNRNTELRVTNLLGINIDKFFMPSVANVVGTDMTSYKIVKMGQFACNRMHVGRDQRLPVSLSRDSNDFLVSPAYNVFEVIDPNALLPEYLMMWFSRREFDRNAWFYTDADVRGGLNWKDFCNMEIPVPDIAKQREIVKEYNVLVNRIALNNQLNQKLEETAQAIYKQWFVDFEFPDEDGKPYKSNGGKMVESELGEIPKGWEILTLSDVTEMIIDNRGKNPEYSKSGYPAISAKNVKNGKIIRPETIRYVSKKVFFEWMKDPLKIGDIALTSEAPMGELFYFAKRTDYLIAQRLYGIRADLKKCRGSYLYFWLQTITAKKDMEGRSTGTTVAGIKQSELFKVLVLTPIISIVNLFDCRIKAIMEAIEILRDEDLLLNSLKQLLLSRLTILN